jgi:hypothetical protein
MMINRRHVLTAIVLPKAVEQWHDPEQREFYLSGLRLATSATE